MDIDNHMRITNNNLDCGIVNIMLHDVCNYKCTYCSPYHYGGKHRWPTNWENYVDLLEDMEEHNKYLLISLLGGEPTLMPKFDEFCKRINAPNRIIEICTNGSRTLRYWNNWPEDLNVYIVFSWHSEFADDDHFFNVIQAMQSKGEIVANLQVTPENFDRARKLAARIIESEATVTVNPKLTRVNIQGDGKLMDYTPEQIKWINKPRIERHIPLKVNWPYPWKIYIDGEERFHPDMIANNEVDFRGWSCMAGIKSISVEKDGTIRRCCAGAGFPLGNINTVWQLPTQPHVCEIISCHCKLDTMVEKWK